MQAELESGMEIAKLVGILVFFLASLFFFCFGWSGIMDKQNPAAKAFGILSILPGFGGLAFSVYLLISLILSWI